jgi:Tfp pilus assembly protein PilN
MNFLSRFSPIAAYRDLRAFLSERRPHELVFAVLAITMTLVVISVFAQGSNVARPYKREIIYVQQWPLDRTEAQILAQQKIDQVEKAKRDAIAAQQQKDLQAQWKRLDDKLNKWGI